MQNRPVNQGIQSQSNFHSSFDLKLTGHIETFPIASKNYPNQLGCHERNFFWIKFKFKKKEEIV